MAAVGADLVPAVGGREVEVVVVLGDLHRGVAKLLGHVVDLPVRP